MLEETRITDERMKNSVTKERRTHIPHIITPPALLTCILL